jgi:putative inorganic carbon (hco3(-)) transporter
MEDKLKAGQWLFVLFVFTLPFATTFNILGAAVQLSDLVFLPAAFVWTISFALNRKNFRLSWFYAFLAAYAVAVTLSTIASADPSRSSVKLAGKFYLIAISFLTFNVITSAGVLKKVLQAWLIGAGVVILLSLLGIILFYAGWQDASQNIVVHKGYGSLPPGNYPRIEGLFSFPAILCNFLAVTWMFSLALWSNGWPRTRVFLLFASALLIVDAFTLTPGLGGIFLVSGYFFKEKLKSGSKPIFGHLAFVSGLLVAAAFFFVTSISLFSYDSSGTQDTSADRQIVPSVRVNAWQTSLETFLHDPLLGRGVGMPIANAIFMDPSGNAHLLTDAHNTYISVLGETGLVGFVTFMCIVGFAAVSLIRCRPAGEAFKTIRLCLLLAILDAFFYQSLTGSYEDARHLWVLFGMAAAVGIASRKLITNS